MAATHVKKLITLEISECPSLASVFGLDDISTLDGLYVVDNPVLENLDALGGLQSASTIRIERNASLSTVNFPALAALSSLELRSNAAMESIEGFPRVTSVDQIVISDNPELRRLPFAPDLESAWSLDIQSNPRLPTCEAERFAAGVASVQYLTISGNDDAGVCAP